MIHSRKKTDIRNKCSIHKIHKSRVWKVQTLSDRVHFVIVITTRYVTKNPNKPSDSKILVVSFFLQSTEILGEVKQKLPTFVFLIIRILFPTLNGNPSGFFSSWSEGDCMLILCSVVWRRTQVALLRVSERAMEPRLWIFRYVCTYLLTLQGPCITHFKKLALAWLFLIRISTLFNYNMHVCIGFVAPQNVYLPFQACGSAKFGPTYVKRMILVRYIKS